VIIERDRELIRRALVDEQVELRLPTAGPGQQLAFNTLNARISLELPQDLLQAGHVHDLPHGGRYATADLALAKVLISAHAQAAQHAFDNPQLDEAFGRGLQRELRTGRRGAVHEVKPRRLIAKFE